ncbi:hypothetical protein MLD38_026190 [Melastoma candidum]|uniref:Uncharacterized protein n=1 Tax=Melastoma candidum TaxID=119954 RepID=A0ACB9NZM5_9MYRT|nr:hypothetical protein MLD38_026190 [Melastoma candidum]
MADGWDTINNSIHFQLGLKSSVFSSFSIPIQRYSLEEPHQSIPNLVVKLYCGDDTVGEVLTHPPWTNLAEEPLGFRGIGFSPMFTLLKPTLKDPEEKNLEALRC